jgi:hypothetical protein
VVARGVLLQGLQEWDQPVDRLCGGWLSEFRGGSLVPGLDSPGIFLESGSVEIPNQVPELGPPQTFLEEGVQLGTQASVW